MDPRASQLGQRTLLPRAAEPALDAPITDAAAHRDWRIQLGIAEGASEIPAGALGNVPFWLITNVTPQMDVNVQLCKDGILGLQTPLCITCNACFAQGGSVLACRSVWRLHEAVRMAPSAS